MYMIAEVSQYVAVASFTEAWIEISIVCVQDGSNDVASFTEAWIEIHDPLKIQRYSRVASFTEAWIEIRINANLR